MGLPSDVEPYKDPFLYSPKKPDVKSPATASHARDNTPTFASHVERKLVNVNHVGHGIFVRNL